MTTQITGISSLTHAQLGSTNISSSGQAGEFGNILASTIDSLQSMQNNATAAAQSFISGENEELHTTVLATQKAELAFELGLQVRNKVVDAYQEVMKMQM